MEKVMWKLNGLFKADAQKCFEEMGCQSISPEEVLEKAKDENSELHKCFEWNDGVAANKYRLLQARQVIQFIVKVPEMEEEHPTRVFQISSKTNTYQPTVFFQRNNDEYQQLLDKALAELQNFKKRYKALTELETVFDAIENL